MPTPKVQSTIHANGVDISVVSTVGNEDDYISLTDIAKYHNPEFPGYVIQNWMRNRSTIEFLGLWEKLNNPEFNYLDFEAIKNASGENSFAMTPKKWCASTNAIGIISKQGRYAATLAHKDIAFEFASWISPEFKLYIIKDYQRLKGIVMEKRSEEKLDKWIRDKQKHTYVRINEKWQKCDFKYPGWIKE